MHDIDYIKENMIEDKSSATDLDTTSSPNSEDIKQLLHAERLEMKSQLESEYRHREHNLRDSLQRLQFESNQEYESLLAQKDDELLSMREQINSQSIRHLTVTRGIALDTTNNGNNSNSTINNGHSSGSNSADSFVHIEREFDRGVEAQDQLKELISQRDEYQRTSEDYAEKWSFQVQIVEGLEFKLQKIVTDHCAETGKLQMQLESVTQRLQSLQEEIEKRPPVDLRYLSDNLLWECNISSQDSNSRISKEGNKSTECKWDISKCKWPDMEKRIVDTLRKANSTAAELRSVDYERSLLLSNYEQENETLKVQILDQRTVIERLERDLKNAIKVTSSPGVISHAKNGVEKSSSAGCDAEFEQLLKPDSFDGRNVVTGPFVSAALKSSSNGVVQGNMDVNGSNCSSLMVMRSLQDQRDRMMETARSRETEANSLRLQLEHIMEEKKSLRNDNVELYRRLRVLRCGTTNENNTTGLFGNTATSKRYISRIGGGGSTYRNRGSTDAMDSNQNRGMLGDDDDVESRYHSQYESDLDPFKMEELDKYSILQRRNIFERALVYLMKFFMQDEWTRNALMIYLLLVHIFALGYVIIVLTPELDTEISHLESAWLSETVVNHESITTSEYEALHPSENWFADTHPDNAGKNF